MAGAQEDQLSSVLAITGRLIWGVRDEQWADPTPCLEWNVRDLVSHVVMGNRLFAGILTGTPPGGPDGPPGPAPPPSGLPRAYQDSAADLVAAFGQPGVLDRVFTVPFGTVPGSVALHLRSTEILAHGWDVARATGQAADFPADTVEQELAFSAGLLGRIPPDRHPFAPSRPVAADAPAIDRLAALLGREVEARPRAG
jgi:uncharacterized protein (TIGR03086 family)